MAPFIVFFVLFGMKAISRVVGNGFFQCPRCGQQRQYTHSSVRNWFTLYFIPVLPMDRVGEFVTCHYCETVYDPQVLAGQG